MKTYTNKTFSGFYPVGSAAVVQASSMMEAAKKLNAVLKDRGLAGDAKPEDMVPFPESQWEDVRILNDGDY
jgi:hypothetical protein